MTFKIIDGFIATVDAHKEAEREHYLETAKGLLQELKISVQAEDLESIEELANLKRGFEREIQRLSTLEVGVKRTRLTKARYDIMQAEIDKLSKFGTSTTNGI